MVARCTCRLVSGLLYPSPVVNQSVDQKVFAMRLAQPLGTFAPSSARLEVRAGEEGITGSRARVDQDLPVSRHSVCSNRIRIRASLHLPFLVVPAGVTDVDFA